MSEQEPTHIEAWKRCLKIIADTIDSEVYTQWFLPIRPLSLKNNILVIRVPSEFFKEYLETHYIELLAKVLRKVIGPKTCLEYNVVIDEIGGLHLNMTTTKKVPYHIYNNYNKDLVTNFHIENHRVVPGLKQKEINSQLMPVYTFENFVEGNCNRLARQAGMEIANKPGKTPFNPFVIHSEVGLGKTHLLHAIGNLTKQKNPDKTVLYVSAEKFIDQFICYATSKDKHINDFVHFYQIIDVLLIDDIQFFEKAPKSQDALFAIFNHLHSSGKQIILTSDRPPQSLENVAPRLISRFKCGLVDALSVPDANVKYEILKIKCKEEGVTISDEVLRFLADYNAVSIRDLEGIRLSLIGQSMFNKKEINMELAREVLKNFVKSGTNKKEISYDTIQQIVSEHFQITIADMIGKKRTSKLVIPRQLSMYLLKSLTNYSLKDIGRSFGGRDHTTVMYSIRAVQNSMDIDKDFKRIVLALQEKIELSI